MIYLFGIILLCIVISFVIVFFRYVKLCDIKDSLDISINKIEDLLAQKLDLITSLLEKVKDDKIKSKFKYNETDSLIDREDVLFETSFDINMYFKNEDNKKIVTDDILEKIHDLNVYEEELEGLKDFYNANVLDYNDIYLKNIFNIIFKRLKFHEFKSFKIRKLEKYEIFKN